MNDFIAVGNDELGGSVKKGDTVVHEDGRTGPLFFGIDGKTGEESTVLGFINVGNNSYLVAIAGKLMKGWRKI